MKNNNLCIHFMLSARSEVSSNGKPWQTIIATISVSFLRFTFYNVAHMIKLYKMWTCDTFVAFQYTKATYSPIPIIGSNQKHRDTYWAINYVPHNCQHYPVYYYSQLDNNFFVITSLQIPRPQDIYDGSYSRDLSVSLNKFYRQEETNGTHYNKCGFKSILCKC